MRWSPGPTRGKRWSGSEAREEWLKGLLKPPHGIPSDDTFGRVFARLDPHAFGKCVADWMGAVCQTTGLRHVAVDGKACRSAPGNTFSGCLHLVCAWATESRLILGQHAVADGSHEIAAISELLRVLELTGALVTLDAAAAKGRSLPRSGARAGTTCWP